MHIRSTLAVLAILGAIVATDTACSSKKGANGLGDGTELTETDLPTTVGAVIDEAGNTVTGARFEDLYEKVQGVNFAPVYFGFDSYTIPPQEMRKVREVADHLKANDTHVLVVEGNCDERGSNEYNLSLGENRAQTVRVALLSLGIGPERIQTRSFGEEKPAVQGSGEEVWRLNRRDEFSFYQTK